MKYAVKNTCYEASNPEKPHGVYFFGKDGYVHNDTFFLEGWKARRFAEAFIAREMNGFNVKQVSENVNIENKRWVNVYEVVELQD